MFSSSPLPFPACGRPFPRIGGPGRRGRARSRPPGPGFRARRPPGGARFRPARPLRRAAGDGRPRRRPRRGALAFGRHPGRQPPAGRPRPRSAGSQPAPFRGARRPLLFAASDGFRTLLYAYQEGVAGGEPAPLIELPPSVDTAVALGGRAYYFTIAQRPPGALRKRRQRRRHPAAGRPLRRGWQLLPGRSRSFAHGGALYFSYGYTFYRLAEGEAPAPIEALFRARRYAALEAGRFVMQAAMPAPRRAPSRG